MPRDRSSPRKFVNKRVFLTGNPMKKNSHLQQMRSNSLSPSRRCLSFQTLPLRREHENDSSKYSGRHYEHDTKLMIKRSRKRSMSPCKHIPSRKSRSPIRKSPVRKICSSFYTADPQVARRANVNYRLVSNPGKHDYDRSRDDRRLPSPAPRKKHHLHISTFHHRHDSSSLQSKILDSFRNGVEDECFISSGHERISTYHEHESLKTSHGAGESLSFSGTPNNDLPTKSISTRFSSYSHQNSADSVRYEDHYNSEFRNNIYDKRDRNYTTREEQKLLEHTFHSGETLKPYSSEELKKITVDIRRNIPRENDSINRRIINPDNVQLVRRADEGVHPIFDRDEIKQGMMERNDDFSEKRVVAIVSGIQRSRSPDLSYSKPGFGMGYHENFKVHRQRYDSFEHEKFESRPRLSDRWQPDSRNKFGSLQNEKNMHEDFLLRGDDVSSRQIPYCDSYLPDNLGSYDGDRHLDFDMTRRPLPTNPHDLRHSLMFRGRQLDMIDARRRILEGHERNRDISPTHYIDYRQLDMATCSRSQYQDECLEFSSNWDQEHFRDKWKSENSGANLPNFAARPNRYQYKEWLDKPDMVPKGPSYFEHDTRDGDHQLSRRGYGRGFRGFSRGRSFYNRGNFERHRGHGRGAFVMSRRGKRSPHQWEHDLFETSPEGKMEKGCQALSIKK